MNKLWLLLVLLAPLVSHGTVLRPVLILPGFMGSVLEWPADKPGQMEQCWINPTLTIEHLSEWLAGMMLQYDPVADIYTNNTKQITTIGYGDITGISTLGSGEAAHIITYFEGLLKELITRGYTPGHNLRSTPFDWRLCPYHPQMRDWWNSIGGLVEEMYAANNNTPVVILGHSLGGVTGAYFLGEKDAAWKKKYVDYFVTMAAPLGGAVKALAAIMSGTDFGFDLLGVTPVPYLRMRETCRTWASVTSLLPNMDFGVPLVVAGTKTYQLADMQEALLKSGANATIEMMRTSYHAPELDFPHPGVPTYCTVGSGHKTVLTLHYKTDGEFDVLPDTDEADGDGTVLKQSADRCKEWANDEFPFTYSVSNGASHVGIVRGADYYMPIINEVIFRPEK